jgi:hypothetical protein
MTTFRAASTDSSKVVVEKPRTAPASFANRRARLDRLEKSTEEYVAQEHKRIKREVKVLKAVLKGRTGGQGADKSVIERANKASEQDLASFLRGT